MNKTIEAFKKQRQAERENRDRIRGLSSGTLAKEHAAKVQRFRTLQHMGVSRDSVIMRELNRDLMALAKEIRARATRGEMRTADRHLYSGTKQKGKRE